MSIEHIHELTDRLTLVAPAVNALRAEIERLIGAKITRLVADDNEQIRGGIHALQEILDLPAALQSERDQITSGLSNEPDPDFQ